MNLRTTPKKIAVLVFDADDCIYTSEFDYLQDSEEAEIGELILKTHADMLEQQGKKLREGGYDKVIIANFSSRQSITSDKESQQKHRKNPSCVFIAPVLQRYFQKNLSCEVVLDTLWTDDLISKKENGAPKQTGDTYFAALKAKNETEIPDEKIINDQSKSVLFQLHCQRAAALHPYAEKIDISFFDDSDGILECILDVFTENPFLFPKKCSATLVKYNHSILREEKPIVGTGPIIPAYDWAYRYLCILMGKIAEFNQSELSTQIEQFHQKNGYFKTKKNHAFIRAEIRFVDFEHFNNACKHLAEMKSTLGKETGYTTAEELCMKGLISEALIGEVGLKEKIRKAAEKEKRYSFHDTPCCFLRQSLVSSKPQSIEESKSSTLTSKIS